MGYRSVFPLRGFARSLTQLYSRSGDECTSNLHIYATDVGTRVGTIAPLHGEELRDDPSATSCWIGSVVSGRAGSGGRSAAGVDCASARTGSGGGLRAIAGCSELETARPVALGSRAGNAGRSVSAGSDNSPDRVPSGPRLALVCDEAGSSVGETRAVDGGSSLRSMLDVLARSPRTGCGGEVAFDPR